MDNKNFKNMDPYSTSAGIIEINPELRNIGYADGINIDGPLSEEKKNEMINLAAEKFGEFLDALGCDWKNDPNSKETPTRVAKAYVNDLWAGRYNPLPKITTFPNLEYDGMIFQGNIPLISMCSHHHQTIMGRVHIAYIPEINQEIIGLSKINRIVEHYGRRGAIQENLTVRIHDSINSIIKSNKGVAVMIEATHNCVQCRGVGHSRTKMKTSKLTGDFIDLAKTRNEFYEFIKDFK
jgi:GTP cyclohydrolase I